MASQFYVWSTTDFKDSACRYYRCEVPMGLLRDMDYINLYMDDGKVDHEESHLARLYSDIMHTYAVSGEAGLALYRSTKKLATGVRDGKEIYPPAIIYDIDDCNDFVHPFNVDSFAETGVRGYPDARLLKPGEGLDIRDHKGNVIAQWADQYTKNKTTTFDVARNLQTMKTRHQIIREAHGVTVCSPTLAKYMRDVIGAKNVHVFPNTIVPEHYSPIRTVRTDQKVRILWQGGMSHYIDWFPLRDALRVLSDKYKGQITWVIYGEYFNWIHDNIPDDMVEHHQWDEYAAYKLRRGLLNIDINLCPLTNNVFNSGKSAIKWYEAAIQSPPEATLAAVSPCYAEIVDGETGILYTGATEFTEKLSLLIENPDLRRRVAEGAQKWVLANRTPQYTIPSLFDFYAETRARQRRELGKPILKAPTMDQIRRVAKPILR